MVTKDELRDLAILSKLQLDEDKLDELTEQMKIQNGVTEQMKAEDQMKWVGLMNSIRHSAEEVVLRDLIYA